MRSQHSHRGDDRRYFLLTQNGYAGIDRTDSAGFSGNFSLEMGVKDAPELARQDDTYIVSVPKSGRALTATLIEHPHVTFKNASDGAVKTLNELLVAPVRPLLAAVSV